VLLLTVYIGAVTLNYQADTHCKLRRCAHARTTLHMSNINRWDVVAGVMPVEPPFGVALAAVVKTSIALCAKLHMRPDVFGKVVGTLSVDPGRYDIGLNLKANGKYHVCLYYPVCYT
jgi:hypothetical protein